MLLNAAVKRFVYFKKKKNLYCSLFIYFYIERKQKSKTMLGEYLCDLSWTESENLKRVTCSVGSKFIKTISKLK